MYVCIQENCKKQKFKRVTKTYVQEIKYEIMTGYKVRVLPLNFF